jgi:hypothetical protein
MDRRNALGLLGGLGAGLAFDEARAADHGRGDDKLLAPVAGMHAHFCGFHLAKNNPALQIVTQHYCSQRNEDMHQCVLFDSCEKNARLLGVEYIITDKLYRTLPEGEKKYWHPHTYEVLGGGLIAPGMKPGDEMAFMKGLLHTWGKAWHTWPDPKSAVPTGEPLLIWSLSGDGQAKMEVVAARDKEFGVSTAKIREKRIDEIGLEVPRVSQPKSMDDVGRQWTDRGADKPTPKK